MVGHTGDLDACVRACALVDTCVKELLETVEQLGGRWILTSDHGNADDMVQRAKKTNAPLFDDNGAFLPLTSHTLVRARCRPSGLASDAPVWVAAVHGAGLLRLYPALSGIC